MQMPKWISALLCALALCLLSINLGCQYAKAQPQLEVVQKDAFCARGEKSAHFIVISDRAEYVCVYRKIHAAKLQSPPMPAIDFNTQRVLVAFLGQKSTAGYGIDFQSATILSDATLVVTVTFTEPAADAVLAQVITSPYAMAAVARDGYRKVKFVDTVGKELAVVDIN